MIDKNEHEEKIKNLLREYTSRPDCTIDNMRLWLQEDGYSLRKEQVHFYVREIRLHWPSLRAARELHNLSVRSAAVKAEISATYLSQLEAGTIKDPSPRILYKLAELYGISYADLMRAAGYVVPSSLEDKAHPLEEIISPLAEDERHALTEYLAWYRYRKARSNV